MRRNEELKTRKELNLESTNELRKTIGRESVSGGDEILVQSMMIPISQSSLDDKPAASNPRVLRDDDDDSSLDEPLEDDE